MSPYPWADTPTEAIALQRQLAERVICEDDFGEIEYLAGVDVGFEANNTITRAAVVVLRLSDLQPCAVTIARLPTSFPYVPGLLSFREIPAVLQALRHLEVEPELLLCDGQGIAHPRRFGIAAHLGVLTGLPSIGVAKSRLIGEYREPGDDKGDWQGLYHKGERIGAVLRTRAGIRPLFISVGHKICLESAIAMVMRCVTRYRLPETTRWAHRLASGGAAVWRQLPSGVVVRQVEGKVS